MVAGYAHVREEVETRSIIEYWLGHGQHKLALPYCLGRALRFVAIERWSDLQPGRFGVPEPAELFREDSTRMVAPEQCDVIIVPGVAFTRRGDRLGHGQGYYDRYLAVTRPDAMRIALAFECQLVDELPTEPHDYRVDVIVTEAAVCYCHG